MKLLSIDTSTKVFSLAVSFDERIVVEQNIKLDKILSSSIIPAIEQALKKAKISINQLDGFALGLGPGSFTSLRVGLSTIKAFAFATQKPVVGIASLDVIAMSLKKDQNTICVVTDARRDLVYACLYQAQGLKLTRKSDYLLISMDELLKTLSGKVIFAGDAISLFRNKILKAKKKNYFEPIFSDEKYWNPRARHLAALALQRFKSKKLDDASRLVPLYLYPEDCQVVK